MVLRIYRSMLTLAFAWGCLAAAGNCVWGLPQTDEDEPAVEVSELSEELPANGIIDFARDVSPILTDKCLECHGPKNAKNDFRVDIATSLLDYIEPGNAEGSSLWTDYLITDDEDMRMPPMTVEQHRRLTAAELATIKLWIEEGGMWNLVSQVTALPELPPDSMAARVWHFQGLFHPATVHFPIALLTVSACFVLLSFVRPDTCEPVAFHCLWIGALGGIVASAAGWAYAVHAGYGPSFSFDLFNSSIDRHRWLGIAVSILAVLLIPIAMYVRRKQDVGMRLIWLIGSLLVLAGVSITGFQGGELTYGEGHYAEEFIKLFPEAILPQQEPTEGDVATTAGQANASAERIAAASESEDPSTETPDETLEEAVASTEAPEEMPVETPEATPAETSAPTTSEMPAEAPVEEMPSETPAEPTVETTPPELDGGSADAAQRPDQALEVLQDVDDSTRPPPVAQPPALAD